MHQQTITTNPKPNILIRSIPGDLRVAGWERSEIMVKTDGDDLNLTAESDPIVIDCNEDLIVYLPRSANLTVDSVAGDASLQAIQSPITLGPVSGDLTMHDLGPVTLGIVSGDANLRNIGALNAGTNRTLANPLSFLVPGRQYTAHRYSHGASLATRSQVRIERQPVDAASALSCTLGPTDGAAINLESAAR